MVEISWKERYRRPKKSWRHSIPSEVTVTEKTSRYVRSRSQDNMKSESMTNSAGSTGAPETMSFRTRKPTSRDGNTRLRNGYSGLARYVCIIAFAGDDTVRQNYMSTTVRVVTPDLSGGLNGSTQH